MTELAIELEACSYTYDSGTYALRDISCSIEAGTWAALVGENGSGKSTLAKLCTGLLKPQEGRVCINGEDISRQVVGEVAREVGYLFQNPDQQIFAPTVREEIAFGLRNLGFADQEQDERVEEALARFDLTSFADRAPATLGFGLRRQVTLASLLARHPSIYILDEPTTGLDWENTQLLLDELQEQLNAGHTVLLITHDIRLVAERAEHVLVLRRGRLAAAGPVQTILPRQDLLARASLSPPPVLRLSQMLRPFGMEGESLTVDDFYRECIARLSEEEGKL